MKQIAIFGFNDYSKQFLVDLIQLKSNISPIAIQGIIDVSPDGSFQSQTLQKKSVDGLSNEQILNSCSRGLQVEKGYQSGYVGVIEALGQCYHGLIVLDLVNKSFPMDMKRIMETVSKWNVTWVVAQKPKEYLEMTKSIFGSNCVCWGKMTSKKLVYQMAHLEMGDVVDIKEQRAMIQEPVKERKVYQRVKHVHGPGCNHDHGHSDHLQYQQHTHHDHVHGPGCSHDHEHSHHDHHDHHDHDHGHHAHTKHTHGKSAHQEHTHGPGCNH